MRAKPARCAYCPLLRANSLVARKVRSLCAKPARCTQNRLVAQNLLVAHKIRLMHKTCLVRAKTCSLGAKIRFLQKTCTLRGKNARCAQNLLVTRHNRSFCAKIRTFFAIKARALRTKIRSLRKVRSFCAKPTVARKAHRCAQCPLGQRKRRQLAQGGNEISDIFPYFRPLGCI